MALTREVAGAMTHAELVDLVVRQSVLIDELRALVAQQQATSATLEARVRDLERQLAERDRNDPTRRMPGLKPAATPRRRQEGPRKKRLQGFSRRQSPTPTETVVHAAPVCSACGTALTAADDAGELSRKEVLDLPPSSLARIIHHVRVARRCPNPACGKRVPPPRPTVAAVGVRAPRERLGVELLARIALLRAELRLPLELVQWTLVRLHGLELSEGAIVGALGRVAAAGQETVGQIRAAIRASPRVHADETGLREDGTNGYLWSFSTDGPAPAQYFVRGSRHKAVVDAVLGTGPSPAPDAFAGVLVTDFYAAYDHYDGPHQRCWGHLLRDIHALAQRHPHDAGLRQWAAQVHDVYTRARTGQAPTPAAWECAQRAYETELLELCEPFLGAAEVDVPQAVLCRRIQKYLPELFTFVADPTVSSDNNAAERCLRPAVVLRKISGGTRSPAGTDTFTTLLTLFGTWRARNLDPLIACRQMLLTHAAAPA